MDSQLIQTVNRLQDCLLTVGGGQSPLDLPQVVVVGSQSAGKSSVLETIVGRDFLPRGSGIVTRRPLVLQLIHIPPPLNNSHRQNASQSSDPYTVPSSHPSALYPGSHSQPITEYGEFLHLSPGRRFTDFNEIRREIENETARVAGQNKGISKLPIHLKIYSEKVVDLTLVDLPGLTKIPVGDQPTDIERQIRGLVTDYISKPNCVILAVSPANVDLANSDSLKLARTVDPQGRRTIGVLTKLDLMDAGTNALDILAGRVYPLKLGFIGVVNRSQQDINVNKPLEEAIGSEAEFFHNHPAYRNIAHRCGTKFLAKTLNQVLMAHIRDKLPDMKARLNTLMGQTQQELNAFGDSTFLGEQHRGSLILKLMTQFVRDFVSSIDGTSFEISTKELCGGARIYYIFNEVFGHALGSINPTMNLSVQDIRTAIRNSTGPRPSLFVPEVAFDLLVKPQIKLLEPPSLRCVELVYEELMKICHNCTSTELQRYPRLQAQLVEVVSELLRERLGPTSEYVQSLISIQAAYINTNHPAFVQGTASLSRAHQEQHNPSRRRQVAQSSEPDEVNGVLSAPEDDDEPSYPSNLSNGRPGSAASAADGKYRATSSSVHDRIVSGNSRHASQAHSSSSSSTVHLHAPQSSGAYGQVPVMMQSPSSHSAKDTFLNYFFGGAGHPGPPVGVAGRMSDPLTFGHQGLNPMGSSRADNPLAGRRGLEGTAAALDMRSLEKHLEPPAQDHGFTMTDREEMETSLIRSLIASYFSIVRQSIQDLVPKAIMHLLVNHSRESVQNRLVSNLYKENLFADLLYEDEALTAERARVKGLLDAYKEAFKTLSDVL